MNKQIKYFEIIQKKRRLHLILTIVTEQESETTCIDASPQVFLYIEVYFKIKLSLLNMYLCKFHIFLLYSLFGQNLEKDYDQVPRNSMSAGHEDYSSQVQIGVKKSREKKM